MCQATIMDASEQPQPLFDPVKAEEVPLKVVFPPQPMADQEVTAIKGKEAEITITFRANPEPTKVEWIITEVTAEGGESTNEGQGSDGQEAQARQDDTAKEGEDGEESEEETQIEGGGDEGPGNSLATEVTIEMGSEGDKYETSELERDDEDSLKFRAKMKIKSLMKEDAGKKYRLEVTNNKGSEAYRFTLKVTDDEDGNEDEGGNNEEEEEEENEENQEGGEESQESEEDDDDDDDDVDEEDGGGSSAVFIVLLLICIVGVALGSVYIYKQKRSGRATAPMSNLERR